MKNHFNNSIEKKRIRVQRFTDRAFGMFIHFGLYSLQGKGEWTLKLHGQNIADYVKLMDDFTCENVDFEEYALMAREAGMKYIVLTTRHHDGFSLYDSSPLNDYNSLNSACKRDLTAEFVAACRKHGLEPFFYHTLIDWHNGLMKKDFKAYLKYLRDSIEILSTRYGQIGGFWFDGVWEKKDDDWEFDELFALIRKHQPDCIITNNTGMSDRGNLIHPEIDCVTFEREAPDVLLDVNSIPYAGEMCEVTASHWGYAKNDINFKSMRELLENFVTCRRYGTNFLLNITPDNTGKIIDFDRSVLKAFSLWMKISGQAMYDTKLFSVAQDEKGFCLKDDEDNLYFIVWNVRVSADPNVIKNGNGNINLVFPDFPELKEDIRWMDNGERLNYRRDEAGNLHLTATPFIYGSDLVVRVGKSRL